MHGRSDYREINMFSGVISLKEVMLSYNGQNEERVGRGKGPVVHLRECNCMIGEVEEMALST